MDWNGYRGKILRVDLSSGEISQQPLDEKTAREFIGGLGINVKMAYEEMTPGTDPLSEGNPLFIGVGPMVGTNAPGSSRVFCLTRLPANGAVGWGGGGGMNFGCMLKYSGFDHIVVTGKAEKPVYIKIFDDIVEICDAGNLWGKGTSETADELYRIHGRPLGAMTIGPASENMVRNSMAFIDKVSTIGRGGIGAVFGSKNLKAIIVRGSGGVAVADRKRFKKSVDSLFERVRNYPALKECQEMGFLKNMPVLPREFYLEKVKKARRACVGCPIGDKDVLEIREGRFKGHTMCATSAINTILPFVYGISDHYEAIKLLGEMDDLGLDMFEAFALIKFADDLYRNGVITSGDLGDRGIEFNYDEISEWLRKIAMKEGFGALLADGFDAVVAEYGESAREYLPSVSKGLTAYSGVRGPLFWNLLGTMEFGMAVHMRGPAAAPGGSTPLYNTRGADIEWIKRHFDRIGIPDEAVSRILSGKRGMKINVGRLTKYGQEFFWTSACLGLCVRAHINRFYSNKIHEELYGSLTGFEIDGHELLKGAERSYNLLRMANSREGFSREDDKFPENWFEKPRHMDYYENVEITEEVSYGLLDDYYDERGWDRETGMPSVEKIKQLGLDKLVH